MKEKILAAIKAKFPAINLSKKRLEQIAAAIEKKVIDDESKIDAALDDFNSFTPLSEIAKQDDKVRDLEAKLKAAQPPKDKDDKTDKDDKKDEPPVLPADTPDYVKQMLKGFETLSTQVAGIINKETQQTMRQKVTEKLKDVPVSYWGKRAIPEKEEDIEAFITDVTTDYTQFTQELTDKGISVLQTPKNGQQQKPDDKAKASKEEIDAVVKEIM